MRLTLKSKILLLAMMPVLLFALVLSGGAVLVLKKQADTEVRGTCKRLLGDRRTGLEHYVQIAMGGIQVEYDRSASGDLNARTEAIARLSKVKYGKGGYILGYDSQMVRLFRGDSPVDVGRSFRDHRNPSGVYLNRELVEAGKSNGHHVTYTSPLPSNESVMIPKLSYTLHLPKWDMVIDSTINLDGVEAQLVEIRQAINEHIGTLIASIVAIAGVPLMVLLVIGLTMANAMLRPLRQIRQSPDNIAAGEGDLTRHLPMTSRDELGELAGSFNCFAEKIHGLVRQVAGMTSSLKQLMGQMSTQAGHSEQAMEHQHHETDQIATAVNEMSATAHEVAQSAQRATRAARQTDHESQTAKRVVDSSIEHIHVLVDGIRDSGSSLDNLQQDVQSIVSVLGVARSIAEQTNLLALSAAIKTARASEARRDFATVADEVRALASHIQQSTQEIWDMIDHLRWSTNAAVDAIRHSDEAGEDTDNQTNQAGNSLDAIAQLIAAINAINAQVASVAEEQAAAAKEINHDVHQIAGAMDSVADGAQQDARTTRNLVQLGQGLGRLIGQFRIWPLLRATTASKRANRQWYVTEPSYRYSAESAGSRG